MPRPTAPPTGMALCPRKRADGYTPAQILESCTRPSRPAETQTSGYYFRNQTSPRPASANPASPERDPPSPVSNVSCTLPRPASAAPAPPPASTCSARTRQSDRARWSDPSTNPAPRPASPIPVSDPRNFPLIPPKSLRRFEPRSSNPQRLIQRRHHHIDISGLQPLLNPLRIDVNPQK